jgi:chemotaxis protein methyltransferase CheR
LKPSINLEEGAKQTQKDILMIPIQEEDPNFKKILAFLLKAKGFDGHHYKPNYIKRRVAVRMRAMGTPTYQGYLHVLQNNRQEPSLLLDRLTIHVTEFFRDPEVYQAIKTKLFPVLSGVEGTKIKVWCAGCSTGEEPYSVAMMLKEWTFTQPGMDFEIFATDVDTASIRTGEKGEYPVESLRKLTRNQITRWFHLEGPKARVVSDLKRHIRFKTYDLLSDWASDLSDFHLVLCRNLLIYLTSSQQQRLYERFAGILTPGGHLILGLTETLLGPARKYFHCVDIRHRIYQALPGVGLLGNKVKEERATDG